MEMLATVKPKDDLGCKEPWDFSGLNGDDDGWSDRRLTNTKVDRSPQARRINACHCIPVNGGVFEVVGGQ
jgi:hypothetical protein